MAAPGPWDTVTERCRCRQRHKVYMFECVARGLPESSVFLTRFYGHTVRPSTFLVTVCLRAD